MGDDLTGPPAWSQNFDQVVAAAKGLKRAGKGLGLAEVLEAAGVDDMAWKYAFRMAKLHRIDDVEAYYADVLERKLRGPNGAKSKPDDTEDPPPEPEEDVLAFSVVDGVKAITQIRILKAALTLLGIEPECLAFAQADEVEDLPPRRRPGPKPGRRAGARR